MKAKYLITLIVILFSLSALAYAQQPADAKVWFSPQKATVYAFQNTYQIVPMYPVPIGDPLYISQTVTLGYAAAPPIKFCVKPSAGTTIPPVIQFMVTLTFDSQKLAIEPAQITTAMAGMQITASVIEPGKIEVEGITIMGAGSPMSADKSLFQISLPPAAVPQEPVNLQGKVDSFVMASSIRPDVINEQAAAVVKAIPKKSYKVIEFEDENGDGSINIIDLLFVVQKLNEELKYPDGTIIPYSIGDFDKNGEVSITDAMQVARYISSSYPVEKDSAFLSDVNFDGTLTVMDALLIAQYTTGRLENF